MSKEGRATIDYENHIASIIKQIDRNKKQAAENFTKIRYDSLKPKSSKQATPIMQALNPKSELAE